jgi:CRP/FNR family transcriptional regulator
MAQEATISKTPTHPPGHHPAGISQGLRPSIRAVPFADGPAVLRLSARDREHLASIASVMRVAAGTVIVRRGDEARAIFNVSSGTLASFRERPDGSRRILGFLFAEDVFGLARRGVYVNSIRAVTPSVVFRLPTDALTALLTRDAGLQFRFLCKVTHVVRETQRQALMVAQRDPVERMATFLSILEDAQSESGRDLGAIELPMSRQDIADYMNVPVGSIKSALDALEQRGMIRRTPNGSVIIQDRRRFSAITSG